MEGEREKVTRGRNRVSILEVVLQAEKRRNERGGDERRGCDPASLLRRGALPEPRRLATATEVALAVPVLKELHNDLTEHLARKLDDKVERDREGEGDEERRDPRRAEDRRTGRARVGHVEGDVRNDRVDDGGREEDESRGELAEVADDDIAEDGLGDAGRLDAEEPARGEDGVAERELVVIRHVDGEETRVDVVADDGHPLEDEGDGDEDGVEGEALPSGPASADLVEVTVGVHVGDDETEDGDLWKSGSE